ncbi:MAG: hypothetical protein CMJ49_07565 [Planctomycetaceae bacterium]|nr:hypothetical protein [Planctomycetaceae bacterium]
MRDHLLILEDSDVRYQRFTEVLRASQIELVSARANTSSAFIAKFQQYRQQIAIISLDHDLFEGIPASVDAGDGRDVSSYLAQREPECPVIVHSSNAHAASSMTYQLRDAGWNVARVPPIGDNWIVDDWSPVLLRLAE